MQMDRERKNVKNERDTKNMKIESSCRPRLHSESRKTLGIYRLKAKRQNTY